MGVGRAYTASEPVASVSEPRTTVPARGTGKSTLDEESARCAAVVSVSTSVAVSARDGCASARGRYR